MDTPRKPHRWQFRLITLFGAMTATAVGAAAYGMQRHALIAEERASQAIAAQGGWVVRYSDGTSIEFYPTPPARPLGLLCGTGLECTYQPAGASVEFSDEDLALLDDVRKLRSVNFKNTAVSPTAAGRFQMKHPDCSVKF